MQEKPNPVALRMLKQRSDILENLKGIKFKIAVMSGKGGTGKTTVAVNLAAVLSRKNSVGLLDADIDCPNINSFLGIKERFSVKGENRIQPIERFGLKVVSMASLQEEADTAIMWRGPMISTGLNSFLQNTDWGKLDFLVIDMPPGTSDAALSIMQNVDLAGIVVVSTPQGVALTDASKAINMAKKFNVKVLGLVENMSGEIFGKGEVESLAKKLGETFLGGIELRKEIRQLAEKGLIAVNESREAEKEFKAIAQIVLKQLGVQKNG